MLDVLFYLVLVLVAVVIGVLLLAWTRPDTFAYARSVTIAAPPETIFPLINDLGAFNTWNPFLLKDAATRLTYRGPKAGVGAAHDWVGNRHVGAGSVEITGSTPNSNIVMRLDMSKPMAAHNRVEFTLVRSQQNATTVTWAMSGAQPLMAKVMTLFIDCDKMVGGEFEKGLASLKTIAEGQEKRSGPA